MKTATAQLLTGVAVVLLAVLSLAAGGARAGESGTITYRQGCDGQSVMLTITATGYTPYETLQISVLSSTPPFDPLGTSASPNPVGSDGNAVATATFTGLPQSTSVFIAVIELISGGGPFRSDAFTLISCSPQAQLSTLIGQVQALNVTDGITNSLDAKLTHIQDALAAANNNSGAVACNSLNAFIHEVAAQAQSQVITAGQAKALTDAALSIEKALGCA
jgi:hypothetical protein